MKVDLGVWDKLTRLIVGLLLVASLVGIGLWYIPLIRDNERLRREILEMDEQIALEEARKRQAATRIEGLKDDRALEREARYRLNVARPGEIIFQFQASNTNPPPRLPPP